MVAQPKRLVAILRGANENPVNASKAYGADWILEFDGVERVDVE